MEAAINTESGRPAEVPAQTESSVRKWILFLPFAWLWFHLVDNLRLEWLTDPQYSYSLVVPILVVGLLIRRWQRYSGVQRSKPGEISSSSASNKSQGRFFYKALNDSDKRFWLLGKRLSQVLAGPAIAVIVLYLPTRLIEEATPEWRPIGWLLAIETIGLTLYAIYLCQGTAGLLRYGFPICFFLTAVPWPTLFEHPVVQGLSRVNAAMVVNVVGFLGVPAIQHGNIIEVSTGWVGINDACSGIRSLQSSLMVSLFLGEYYFLRWQHRVLLVAAGFLLAMLFNVLRTSFLTFIAAKHGTTAIAQYHDEAGMTILLACTASLMGVGYLASRLEKRFLSPTAADAVQNIPSDGRRAFSRLAFSLIAWIFAVEVGVASWYAYREAKIKPGPAWTIALPEGNSTLQSLPFTAEEHQLLRFDDGKQGRWEETDGTFWQAFYFDWLPGRVAGYLAKRHTPDICLPAEGMKMLEGPTLIRLKIHDRELPVRSYVFTGPNGTCDVFQCHWEPGENNYAYSQESSRYNLIRGIWAGRGNKGQKVIEVIVTGFHDMRSAQHALVGELEKLIRIQKS